MANLQILKKRLKTIESTGEMALAMKTVSSVKYTKLNRVHEAYAEYAQGCADALELLGASGLKRSTDFVKKRNCFVYIGANRGFCGGFNLEMARFFDARFAEEAEPPLVIALGKRAEKHCREKGIEGEFLPLDDIPAYEDAKSLAARLFSVYQSGEADKIFILSQSFKNMMKQQPEKVQFLPRTEEGRKTEENILFLPDRETLGENPVLDCLVGYLYGILISQAAGAQAATMIAMKNACDNADEAGRKLSISINRIRQAEVTNSVIETSAGMAAEFTEN